jgi:hypothetical protein
MEADAKGELQERSVRTGNFIFENEWQAFRTRQDRTLEMKTAPHDYPKKGKYKIAVKVIVGEPPATAGHVLMLVIG